MAQRKYEEWLEEDKLILIEGWARDGLTEEQIAHNMGIAYSTLKVWKNEFTAIMSALKKGKEVSDYIVECALYKTAIGHHEKVKKPIKVKVEKSVPNKGKIIEEKIEYVEEDVYIPPNVTAQIYWLKNRRRGKWMDKPIAEEVKLALDDGLIEALNGLTEDLIDDNDFLPEAEEGGEDGE